MLNNELVMEHARSEYIERRDNIIAVGNSSSGKSHIALGLGLAASQKSLSVGSAKAAALGNELLETHDKKRCSARNASLLDTSWRTSTSSGTRRCRKPEPSS